MSLGRNRQRRLGIAVAAALAGGGFAVVASHAQDAPQAAPEPPAAPGWQKFCDEHPQTKEQVCVVTRQLRAATGQSIAAFSIRASAERFQFVAAVPPGMQLRPGMQVEIDGASTQRATFTVCIPDFCFADAEVGADYLTALKRGNELVITSIGQDGRPVKFPISLTGFTASYDGEPLRVPERETAAGGEQLQDELSKRASDAREKLIRRQQELRADQ